MPCLVFVVYRESIVCISLILFLHNILFYTIVTSVLSYTKIIPSYFPQVKNTLFDHFY